MTSGREIIVEFMISMCKKNQAKLNQKNYNLKSVTINFSTEETT